MTNRHAQVLDGHDRPVPGLYAVGNVAAAFHQGIGYTGGAIIGHSLTFGYVAAQHVAATRPSTGRAASAARRLPQSS